jgi:thioredoxin 1
MQTSISHASDVEFEQQVIQSSVPVLVDFWGEWCAPCKVIAPMLEELAQTFAGRLKVVKINIDKNRQTPRIYRVRGAPTLMIFKNGKVEATQVGALNKTQLIQLIERTL